MAAREHSCTRRDLLARAVGGAHALTLPPLRDGSPSPPAGRGVASEWEAAVAALRRAEEEIAAFKAAEPKGVSFARQWALDEAFSDLACAHNAALERLLGVPAPDVGALALKLALAVEEIAWELPEGEASMAMIAADAARLARRRRSPRPAPASGRGGGGLRWLRVPGAPA
jgi:hypothetical protein